MKAQKEPPKTDPAIDIPIEQHVENFKREGEDLRTAFGSSTAIASRSETAAAAEKEAREKLAIHEAASAEAKVIQADWSKLVADLAILRQRSATAHELLRSSKEIHQKKSDHLKGYFGGEGSTAIFLEAASKVATIGIAIPWMESAVKHIDDLVREHLKTMRAFGKLHGLPQEVLAGLA